MVLKKASIFHRERPKRAKRDPAMAAVETTKRFSLSPLAKVMVNQETHTGMLSPLSITSVPLRFSLVSGRSSTVRLSSLIATTPRKPRA
jgi:hypothetical protein